MEYVTKEQVLLNEELCGKAVDRDDRIVKATLRFRDNIKLVYYVCRKFSEPRDAAVDKDDIVQVGYEGLWRACLDFDESKGAEFSTYAVPTIKGYILRMLNESNNLKVPRQYADIRRALNKHGFKLPLTDEEIDILVSEGKFSRKQILDYAEPIVQSLDDYTMEDSESTLGSVIPDPNAYVDKDISDEEIEHLVDSVLQYIKHNHRDMVEEWMYATIEGVKLTQKELSKKYGLSQPYCNRILNTSVYLMKNNHGDAIRNLFGY